jgi:hypothetical protein
MSDSLFSLADEIDSKEKSLQKLLAVYFYENVCKGVESVEWLQYTPLFNDGDPCVFRAYFLDGIYGVYPSDVSSKNINKAVQALEKVPLIVYEQAFGDSVRVTAKRLKDKVYFTVERIDHD